MNIIQGLAVADGYAVGKAHILAVQSLECERVEICAEQIPQETEKLEKAQTAAKKEIESLIAQTVEDGEDDQHAIFECYLELITDDELKNDVVQYMKNECVNLDTALQAVCTDYVNQMLEIDDPYLQARAEDFKQVFRMIKSAHLGKKASSSNKPLEPFILAAKEIGPADMAGVDKKLLQGFVLETGSRTSHAAIISRSMGIPMMSGIKEIEKKLSNGINLALDGSKGIIYIEPEKNIVTDFNKKIEEQKAAREENKKLLYEPAITLDGKKITLYANIGTVEELDGVLENNADGIGLFRTEFLFMEHGGNKLPTEEEQFEAYKTVLQKMNGKPVIFRTLDAGGDKNVAALGIPKEENPFLGWRAIRYCLKRPDVFKTQLRALLRASKYGSEKIMLPMIINTEEIIQTQKLLEEIYAELAAKGEPIQNRVPLGIMIETPAAAVNAQELAKMCDFFSLGTNDLTQYTLAVDRGNEHTAELYNEAHPAVLSLIEHVIKAGNKEGIPVDLCGEMAGDDRFTQELLKRGLREFSMSPIRILEIKKLIRSIKTI